MTTKDYLRANPEENLSWCKPYIARDGELVLILNEGNIIWAKSPTLGVVDNLESHPDRPDVLNTFLHELNPECDWDYDDDDDIDMLRMMSETGCAHCPCFEDCQAFDDDEDDEEEGDEDEEG